MPISYKIIAVSTIATQLAPPGQSDSGLATPKNEAGSTRVWLHYEASTTPGVADVICSGKCCEPAEQVQFQRLGDGESFDGSHWWAAVPSGTAPATGATSPAHAFLAKVNMDVNGRYTIDSSAYAFSTGALTQPAVSSTVTLGVTSTSGFAVNDVVYHEIGCLYDVTAVNAGAGTITLSNRGEPAAAVSVGA